MKKLSPRLLLFATLSLFLLSVPAGSFYEKHGDRGDLDIRLFLRLNALWAMNPEGTLLYKRSEDKSIVAIGRFLLSAKTKEDMELKANILLGASVDTFGDSGYEPVSGSMGVERSRALERVIRDEGGVRSQFVVDHLNFRMPVRNADVTIGRQPINFATTFYFTPNDFFAPFSAETFFREYKPGVDSARADIRLGPLSQLTLAGVLGYREETSRVGGWGDSPLIERSSFLARAITVVQDIEMGLIGGKVRKNRVLGGSVQGELLKWLGIRGEGHYSLPEEAGAEPFGEISIGFDHRFENSLDVRLEAFHHGSGYSSTEEYGSPRPTSKSPGVYFGKRYAALGVGYELSPLANGEFLYLANLDDHSGLFSFYLVYSVSNEGELSFGLYAPYGEKPGPTSIESEFGAYPTSFEVEFRIYF